MVEFEFETAILNVRSLERRSLAANHRAMLFFPTSTPEDTATGRAALFVLKYR